MKKETNLKEKSTRVRRKDMQQAGPLYIDESLKTPGKVLRIVNADKPGRVKYLQRLGYTIKEDPDFKVGDDIVGKSLLGSSVTVELSTTTGKHCQGVVMEIDEDIYDEIKADKEEEAQEIDKALGRTGISTQYGEITIGNKKIS